MTTKDLIDEEVTYPSDYMILSTTDLDSIITHVNDDFMAVSGYKEDELINKPHNIVRHPDMPKAAFSDLWDTIKQGKSWMGLVKNRCKNGQYYWVNAYVTPIKRNGIICEYQSVRTQPEAELTERAQACYDAINAGKAAKPKFGASIITKLFLAWLLSVGLLMSLPYSSGFFTVVAFIVAIICFCRPLYVLKQRFSNMLMLSEKIHDNPLNQFVYTGYTDELSHIELSLRMQKAETLAVVGRIKDSGEELQQGLEEHQQQNQANQNQLVTQSQNLEQVVTAIGQMSTSVTDIAKNTTNSTTEIHHLVEQIESTKVALANSQIATTAGRGFAVVADEVRNLASRSATSAHEIHAIINSLSRTTAEAVAQMEQSHVLTDKSIDSGKMLEKSLISVSEVMSIIESNGEQISVAAEEQAAVVNQIYSNAMILQDGINQFEQNCQNAAIHSQEISGQGIRQTELVNQFN